MDEALAGAMAVGLEFGGSRWEWFVDVDWAVCVEVVAGDMGGRDCNGSYGTRSEGAGCLEGDGTGWREMWFDERRSRRRRRRRWLVSEVRDEITSASVA